MAGSEADSGPRTEHWPAKRRRDAENGVTSFGDYRKQVGMVWFTQFLL